MDLAAIQDPLTLDIIESGCVTWEDLVRSVRNFKYERLPNNTDFENVWYQRKGTCSSKHGFLYSIAQTNNFDHVQLILGVYLMTGRNTPCIDKLLKEYNLYGVPEAHCYLKVDNAYLDATSTTSSYSTFSDDLMLEEFISLEFLKNKQDYHREFLEKWKRKEDIPVKLETLWNIREQCIQLLSDS